MARITVEDCLEHENNRFALVQLASKRTKQLLSGSRPLTNEAKGNKAVVTALREIAEGSVRFMTAEDEKIVREREERLKELGLSTPHAAPVSPADDLFILPSNGAKDRIADIIDEDDEEDDIDVEELEADDDLDDADEVADESDDSDEVEELDDAPAADDAEESGETEEPKADTDGDLDN